MIIDLTSKLNKQIDEKGFREECDVVYFMVGMRKILERKDERFRRKYPILSFYLDWVVHPRLNGNGSIYRIITILNQFDSDNKYHEISTFCNLDEFRSSLHESLVTNELKDFTSDGEMWAKFRRNLIAVISDQPISVPKSSDFKNIKVERIFYKFNQGPNRIAIDVIYRDYPEVGHTTTISYGLNKIEKDMEYAVRNDTRNKNDT